MLGFVAVVALGVCLAGPSAQSQEEQDPAAPAAEDARGYLTVFSNPDGVVFIDGSDTGFSTPMQALELPGGLHRVMVYVPQWDHSTMEREVVIRAGVEMQLTFNVVSAEPMIAPLAD